NMEEVNGNIHWLETEGIDMGIFSQYGPEKIYENHTQLMLSYSKMKVLFVFIHQKLCDGQYKHETFYINESDMESILENLIYHKINIGCENKICIWCGKYDKNNEKFFTTFQTNSNPGTQTPIEELWCDDKEIFYICSKRCLENYYLRMVFDINHCRRNIKVFPKSVKYNHVVNKFKLEHF
ncbi:unnamed protein product, partial [marine sediment metagenome]